MENASTSAATNAALPVQQVSQQVPEPKPRDYRKRVATTGAFVGGEISGAAAMHGITPKQREAVEIDNKTKDDLTKQAYDARYPESIAIDSMERREWSEETI